MAAAEAVPASAKPPPVTWAQRKDRIYVVVELVSARDVKVNIAETAIDFEGIGCTSTGSKEARYCCKVGPLKGELDPEKSLFDIYERKVVIIGMKKESGPHWEALVDLPRAQTKSWLTVNWQMWLEEDEEEQRGCEKVEILGVKRKPQASDLKYSDEKEIPVHPAVKAKTEAEWKAAEAAKKAKEDEEKRQAEKELLEKTKDMTGPGDDAVSQVQWEWKQWKDGKITEEEFETRKKKIIHGTAGGPPDVDKGGRL
eukprot:TRINITY_DN6909_c0_g1_i1.p1 TRINITY_DN6909_c0_g1~~TRINITY_DN6909_c0_g1_i1.p1  ORF type:complete len:255 (+),score=101.18 TRINITY_DN6909_c0_g1_i1:56-820(+)